jgi:hypothetical protein
MYVNTLNYSCFTADEAFMNYKYGKVNCFSVGRTYKVVIEFKIYIKHILCSGLEYDYSRMRKWVV